MTKYSDFGSEVVGMEMARGLVGRRHFLSRGGQAAGAFRKMGVEDAAQHGGCSDVSARAEKSMETRGAGMLMLTFDGRGSFLVAGTV